MTEAEWLECADPQQMLRLLMEGMASDRKLRLFGCACCRRVWESLTEDCFRDAVEIAERFADGQAGKKELAAIKKVSGAALERNGLAGVRGKRYCALGTAWSVVRNPQTAAMYPLWVFTDSEQRTWERGLLHEIFGNPFRPMTADPAWTSLKVVAQSIYDDRSFDRLPALADALEESGCTHADILNHFRQPGEHVRGCWALDLILEKT
jgi:hypothetical protein